VADYDIRFKVDSCGSCGADTFLAYSFDGHAMLLDAEPVEGGALALVPGEQWPSRRQTAPGALYNCENPGPRYDRHQCR
jgi:hypothetical protein